MNMVPHDDLTQPTNWGQAPPKAQRNSDHQRVIAAVLMTYCSPLLKYDGMSAWELAGKVLDAIAPAQEATS